MLVSKDCILGNTRNKELKEKVYLLLPLNNSFSVSVSTLKKSIIFTWKVWPSKKWTWIFSRGGGVVEKGGRMRAEKEDSALKQRGLAQTLRPGNGGNGEDVLEFWKEQGIHGDCTVGRGKLWGLADYSVLKCLGLSHKGMRTAAFKQT